MTHTTLQIGLLGFGTVGSGTFKVLQRNINEISRRLGANLAITMVADLNVAQTQAIVGDSVTVVNDGALIVNHPDIQIVIELIGGDTIAKRFVMQAIANGKHVITANKALLAKHGNEIFAAAQAKGVIVAFEAAVAGGIPIIKALREGLTANHIEWVAGIINGTTNFILTEMRDKQLPFADVLQQAQALGYAEADPTFDIEGVDAAHKITLMASLAFGIPIQFDQTYIEGISQITPEDLMYAEQLGYRIKLLGIARRRLQNSDHPAEPVGIELRVHPTLIPQKRLMANVDGVMNAVMVKGDAVGPTLFYGAGAGSEPTASAVLADVVDVARAMIGQSIPHIPALAFQPSHIQALPMLTIDQIQTTYYLRLRVADQAGVLADITRILADYSISIEALIQKEPQAHETAADVVILTHETQEANIRRAIITIEQLSTITAPVRLLRCASLA
jgi:homoserine dehydrogenase